MPSQIQLINGSFEDAQGNPLANGHLDLVLNQDGVVNGVGQICRGIVIRIQLDENGNAGVNPPQTVWGNDQLSPVNGYYIVSGFTSSSQRVWGPHTQQVIGSGSFDMDTWIPNVLSTWTPSPQTVLFEVNGTKTASQTVVNLVAGANTTITDNGAGSLTVASTGGGGGAPTNANYLLGAANGSLTSATVWPGLATNVNVPPASPGTLDDEFDAGSLNGKWSWLNQNTATATFSNSYLVLQDPTSHVGNTVSAIIQTAPATPWTVTTAFKAAAGINHWLTGTWSLGVIVYDSVSSRLMIFGFGTGANFVLLVNDYTNTTTFSSQPFSSNLPAFFEGGQGYLRVQDDGVNLTFSFSYDDIVYTQALQQSRTAFLTNGPNRVGLAVNNQASTGPLSLVSDWFRRTQ